MTFFEGLRNARSHIIFLLALISAGCLIMKLQAWEPGAGYGLRVSTQKSAGELPALAAPRALM